MRLVNEAASTAIQPKADGGALLAGTQARVPAQHDSLHDTLVERGYIHYHSVLAEHLASYKAAIMLGHALYWTRYWMKREPHRGGWFYMTAPEWRASTGLTATEQETARKLLRAKGVWHEQWLGSPARWHYRLNLEALLAMMREPESLTATAGNDWQGLARMLGSPVLYFKPLGDLVGSTSAGLLLSHLLALMRRAHLKGSIDDGGFFKNENPRIALGLTDKVQRNAREALIDSGFIQQRWTQERTPKLMIRLNLTAVMACLSGQPTPRRRGKVDELAHGDKVARIEVAPTQRSLPIGQSASAEPSSPLSNAMVTIARVERLVNASTTVRPVGTPNLPRPEAPVSQARFDDTTARTKPQRLVALHVDADSSRVALSPMLNAKVGPFTELRSALLPTLYIQNLFSEPTTTAHGRAGGSVDNFAGQRSSRDDEISRQAMLEGFRPSKPTRTTSVDVRAPKAPATPRRDQAKQQAVITTHIEEAEPTPETSAHSVELVMPSTLEVDLHRTALEIVSKAPAAHRQRLLDELAGHMQMPRKSIESPLGWLNGIVRKACTGDVIYTMADRVASARKARQSHDLRIANAMKSTQEEPTKAEPPGVRSAEVAARLAKTRAEVLARQAGNAGEGPGLEKDGLPC